MDRRKFMQMTGMAGLGFGMGSVGLQQAFAQGNSVDLFMVSAFSGPFAANGKYGEMGGRLAVSQFTNELKRPINYTPIDTQGNVGVATRKVQEALSQKNARIFLGGALSSEALAMSREINKSNGLYITYVGADEVTGSDCNKATFRWSVPTYGAIHQTVAPVADQNPKAKRWYTITPQYVFGEGLLKNAKAVFADKGIEHVGNSYHSLQEKEFSGYLANAVAANADVLLVLNFSQQSVDTLRQIASFGLKNKMKVVVAWSAGLDHFVTLGADICDGIYFGVQYWHDHDAPGNNAFVKLCRDKFKSAPTLFTAQDYSITTMALKAIAKANSTDPAKIIQALETLKWDGLTGVEEVRPFDHQVEKNYFLLRGKPKNKMRNADDFADVVSIGKSFVSKDKSECKQA
jgi:branched-chain amino acid transport system substrate-binding protein